MITANKKYQEYPLFMLRSFNERDINQTFEQKSLTWPCYDYMKQIINALLTIDATTHYLLISLSHILYTSDYA